MTQPNEITFEDGLILKGFDWSVKSFTHNFDTGTTSIEVLLENDGAKHSRRFDTEQPTAWTANGIEAKLKKLPEFTGST